MERDESGEKNGLGVGWRPKWEDELWGVFHEGFIWEVEGLHERGVGDGIRVLWD